MPELSQEALDEIKEIFSHFDLNHNGTLEICEFRELLIALGGHLAPGEAEAGFDEIDSNNDGAISWNEFVTWWGKRT